MSARTIMGFRTAMPPGKPSSKPRGAGRQNESGGYVTFPGTLCLVTDFLRNLPGIEFRVAFTARDWRTVSWLGGNLLPFPKLDAITRGPACPMAPTKDSDSGPLPQH